MLGGGLGSLARYAAGTAIMSRAGARFPAGTLAINVSGSFLIGLLMVLLTERFAPHPYWRLLLVVGFLGGYTTFSTFEYETYALVRGGGVLLALGNVLASVAAGFCAVWLGTVLASRW
jgi:CrcB protein